MSDILRKPSKSARAREWKAQLRELQGVAFEDLEFVYCSYPHVRRWEYLGRPYLLLGSYYSRGLRRHGSLDGVWVSNLRRAYTVSSQTELGRRFVYVIPYPTGSTVRYSTVEDGQPTDTRFLGLEPTEIVALSEWEYGQLQEAS